MVKAGSYNAKGRSRTIITMDCESNKAEDSISSRNSFML